MKILAIRLARLGDVILLFPALGLLKAAFPDARVTFLTGHRCAPLAELCPHIDEVIPVDRVAMRDGSAVKTIREMIGLVRDIRQRRFDLVVDFHSFRETNLLAWFSGASLRFGLKRYKKAYLKFCFNRPPVLEDKSLHVAAMFRRVVEGIADQTGVNLPDAQNTALLIPNALRTWAAQTAAAGPRLGLYVDAPVPERVWPPEHFAQVADVAIEKLGAQVVVLSGEAGAGLSERLQNASRYHSRLSVFTDLTAPRLAAIIASCRLLVSNDTGPMHLGPAVGVPTLGLFSVGYPEHFRPTGPADRYLRGNPIQCIEVNEVIAAVGEMWATVDRDLRR